MKYYYPEHLSGYERVRAEGKTAWAEIHGVPGFENFSSRPFLEAVLPQLKFESIAPTVLDIGCGTGPDACLLTERGFRVQGIDLVPLAIAMAREIAIEKGFQIRYEVQDVCELPLEGEQYDMIVDSFCLQCIVLNEDRQRVFSAVRARLKPRGYYLVSSAIMGSEREQIVREGTEIRDPETGIAYKPYPASSRLVDPTTGIAFRPLPGPPGEFPDAVQIAGQWYLPHRRHLTPAALEAEIEKAGFRMIYRLPELGSLACVPAS